MNKFNNTHKKEESNKKVCGTIGWCSLRSNSFGSRDPHFSNIRAELLALVLATC